MEALSSKQEKMSHSLGDMVQRSVDTRFAHSISAIMDKELTLLMLSLTRFKRLNFLKISCKKLTANWMRISSLSQSLLVPHKRKPAASLRITLPN
eukprot:9845427-Karenia_brevis.AAC.1